MEVGRRKVGSNQKKQKKMGKVTNGRYESIERPCTFLCIFLPQLAMYINRLDPSSHVQARGSNASFYNLRDFSNSNLTYLP